MTDLLTLVGALYACNLLAAQAPLAPDRALICERTHHTVKVAFLTPVEIETLKDLSTAESYRIGLEGYRRFKTWERDNWKTVHRLRQQQAERLFPRT